MALEYDEDEIGDLEEQGHEIRGFADVAGALAAWQWSCSLTCPPRHATPAGCLACPQQGLQ